MTDQRPKGTVVGAIAADLGTSVAHTPGRAENPGGEAEADLFRGLDEELDGFAGQRIAPAAKRGPGRPPGSPNRTTLQLQRYLQARGYRDPAEFLASIVSMDVRELAAALAGWQSTELVDFDKALEALKVQKAAAAELMPYFHQRLPQQVEHRGDGARPLIVIMDGPAGGAAARTIGAAAMSVHDAEDLAPETADFRGGGDGQAARSHGPRSHEEG